MSVFRGNKHDEFKFQTEAFEGNGYSIGISTKDYIILLVEPQDGPGSVKIKFSGDNGL